MPLPPLMPSRVRRGRHAPARSGILQVGNAALLPYVAPVIGRNIARVEGMAGDALRLKVGGSESLSLAAVGTIPGVAIRAVGGANGPGTGRIRLNGTELSWRAPGSAVFGSTVNCSTDGTYVLTDGEYESKFVRVSVYASYLPASPTEAVVYITDRYNNAAAHDDVTAGEAQSGNAESYTVTVENASVIAIRDVRCWIGEGRRLEIGTDGSNWYTPNFETHPDVVSWANIAASGTETLHVRRTVAAGESANPGILHALRFAWDGF